MKRLLITLVLIALFFRATAPASGELIIPAGEVLYIYGVSDPFLRAVMRFESNYKADAVNPYTKARGVLQILPVMIKEVNKYSDTRYTWDDAFDPVKSIEIWNIIQGVKNPEYYPDKAIRIWFGRGTQHDGMTWCDYYNIVMNNVNNRR
jgi:hypothetical protein